MPASILVGHSSEEARGALEAALYQAGYDVMTATNGEEALRSTAGNNPAVVVLHQALPKVSGVEIYTRLRATGLKLPPFLILYDTPEQAPETAPEGQAYLVSTQGLTATRIVHQVRLLMLAADMGGEFGEEGLELMHGDLARTPIGDLLHALQKHVITGRVRFGVTTDTGLAVRDGAVVAAWWADITGRKAFNRLAGLPSGSFALSLEDPDEERTIDADLETLIVDAVEERLGLDEALADLPSPEARPEVKVGKNFFDLRFTPVQRQVLSTAQKVKTLGQLIDQVPVTDLEAAQAVGQLREQGILTLTEPADRIHLFTDSTADLLPAEARRMGITQLAVSIIFGNEVYKDGIDLQPEDFHRKLGDKATLPVTNPVTKGEFLDAYRRVITTGDILAIHCSAKLSQSYENATAAARDGMDELRELRHQAQVSADPVIITVDSRQASSPLGMLAIFAARMVRQRMGIREIAARVENMAQRIQTLLMVSSLEWLQRTGQIGRNDVTRVKAADARPILAVHNGELKLIDLASGSAKGLVRLLELLAERVDPARPVYATAVHASAPAQAAVLRRHLQQRFNIIEQFENQIGPAVTCHVGPGTIGAGLFQPTAEELELLQIRTKP